MIYTLTQAKRYEELERQPEPQFLELVSVKKEAVAAKEELSFPPTDRHTLLFLLRGSVLIRETGREALPGELLLSPRFFGLTLFPTSPSEWIKILFRSSPFPPLLSGKPGASPLTVSGNFPQIGKIYRLSESKNVLPGVREALLLDLLNDLSGIEAASLTELSLYRRACDWLEANADRPVTSQEAASAMSCSRAYLNRVMKSIDGECLSEKIARYRLERIMALCRLPDLSLKEISDRLGFYSVELLCKFFKYHAGISVGKYRKSVGARGESDGAEL